MLYRIRYYDSDHGGMRDELTNEELFEGTFPEAEAHAANQKSPWGFNYTVGTGKYHGTAVIDEVSPELKDIRIRLNELLTRYKELTGEEYGNS